LNKYHEHMRLFVNFSNILKIYELQLKFLQEIDALENGENPEKIIETYSVLGENMIPIKSKDEICLPVVSLLTEYLEFNILEKLDLAIQKISTQNNNSDIIVELFEELYIKVRSLILSINNKKIKKESEIGSVFELCGFSCDF